MESFNYSGLGNKLNQKKASSSDKARALSLQEITKQLEDSTINYVEEALIYNSYALELESILKNQNIESLIKELFLLENKLEKLKKVSPIDYDIPKFEEFWKNLSKTILLSLWESLENEEESQEIIKGWYESLRISIEAELYNVQEKWGLKNIL